jgi:hypothetical protein
MDLKAWAKNWKQIPAYKQERINRVVSHIAKHGPSAAGMSTPFDDGDLGEARSAGYVKKQEGSLRHELTDKGRALADRPRDEKGRFT